MLIAHSHSFLEAASPAAKKRWFTTVHGAAAAELAKLPAVLHAYAQHHGLDRVPDLGVVDGKKAGKHPTQAAVVPYLSPKFTKAVVKKLLLTDAYGTVDLDDVLLTALLIQCDYLHGRLKLEPVFAAGTGPHAGRTKAPDTKDKMRAELKLKMDYFASICPPGELLDMVRRSYTGKNLTDQELFAADLEAVGGKKQKLKRFEVVRVKSTHEDPNSDVKQTIVNAKYIPFVDVTGPKAITFKVMVADPAFMAAVKARHERDQIPAPVVDAALELLKHRKVAGKAITMVVEIQYFVDAFLEKRKLVHIFYKVFRTKSALELAMDFAKYANGEGESKAMAYALPAAVANEGYAASMAKKWGLAVGPGVTELQLAGKGLGDGDCAWIVVVIAKCPALKSVYLNSNSIGNTGAAALADAMSKSTSLQGVNLHTNSIGDTGAAALADAISKSTSLQGVSLSRNKFSSAGWTALTVDGVAEVALAGFGIKLGKTMWYLSDCGLTDADCGGIAAAISKSTSLRSFHLAGNSIGDTGAIALAGAISKSTSLQNVFLNNNSIGDIGAAALAAAFSKSTLLRCVHLGDNSIGDIGKAALAKVKSYTLGKGHFSHKRIGEGDLFLKY